MKLTEPYMTTRDKGTGLGLAIVKKILEDHGGRLELHDAPADEGWESGARVILCFPLNGASGDKQAGNSEASEEAQGTSMIEKKVEAADGV
jgi:two-component system nitrogen regulation sensor histidine kinase NtrY